MSTQLFPYATPIRPPERLYCKFPKSTDGISVYIGIRVGSLSTENITPCQAAFTCLRGNGVSAKATEEKQRKVKGVNDYALCLLILRDYPAFGECEVSQTLDSVICLHGEYFAFGSASGVYVSVCGNGCSFERSGCMFYGDRGVRRVYYRYRHDRGLDFQSVLRKGIKLLNCLNYL